MTTEAIRAALFRAQDTRYRDFQRKLIPTVDAAAVIGVRTPELRKLARELAKEAACGDFLASLPHRYFDENQLHAFIISEEKDFEQCIEETERFLPYIDNWATCDQMSPKVFKKHRDELLPFIERWISSGEVYTVRFAVGMLMQHYLDDMFDLKFPAMAAAVKSGEYYVNMMLAWYFATALAKQYDAVLPFIEERRLTPWVHNRTIQKAIESFRITPEQKQYLRSLRITSK